MAMSKTIIDRVPIDLFEQANQIVKKAGLAHRTEGYRLIKNLIPDDLAVFKVRRPNSNEEILIMRCHHK